jgi:hypothetical protein
MPETLSIALTPGYLFSSGELVTLDKLNLQARPNIVLTGSIGSATITDGAVTTAKLADGALSADSTGRNKMADGYVTAPKLNNTQDWTGKTLSGSPTVNWSGTVTLTGTLDLTGATVISAPGMLVQTVVATTAAVSSISTTIPFDNTIPQVGEGTELAALAVSITPSNAASILELELLIFAGLLEYEYAVAAIFKDGAANAIAATYERGTGAVNADVKLIIRHRLVAGTTSEIDFTVRVGRTSGGMTINGVSSTGLGLLGGVLISSFTVREVAA